MESTTPELTLLQASKMTSSQAPELTSSQVPEPTTSQVPELTTSQVPELTTSQSPELTSSQAPELTSSQAPELTSSQVPELTSSQVPELTTSQVPELTTSQVPELTSSQAPELTSSQAPEIVSSEAPDVVSSQAPEVVSSQAPGLTTSQVPELTTSQSPKLTSLQAAELTSSEAPEIVSSQAPEVVSSQAPEIVSSQLPEVVSSQAPEVVSSQASKMISSQVSELTSSEVPELTQHDHSMEKNLKNATISSDLLIPLSKTCQQTQLCQGLVMKSVQVQLMEPLATKIISEKEDVLRDEVQLVSFNDNLRKRKYFQLSSEVANNTDHDYHKRLKVEESKSYPVFIGNIENIEETWLKELLKVVGVIVKWTYFNKPIACILCEYEQWNETLMCIESLDGLQICNRKLIVKTDTNTKRRIGSLKRTEKNDYAKYEDIIRLRIRKYCIAMSIQYEETYFQPAETDSEKALCPKQEHCLFCKNQTKIQRNRILHGKAKYQCTLCFQFFKSRFDARKHCQHVNRSNWHCKVCRTSFKNRFALQKHLTVHENMKTSGFYSCSVCHKKFSSNKRLQMHYSLHNISYKECHICYEIFGVDDDTSSHSCGSNSIRFISMFESSFANNHSKRKNDIKKFVKKKYFERKRTCREFIETNDNLREADVCEICKQKFSCKISLFNHIRFQHYKHSHFSCIICSQTFKGKIVLRNHLRNGECKKEGYYTCHLCPGVIVAFKTYNELIKHKQHHSYIEASLSMTTVKERLRGHFVSTSNATGHTAYLFPNQHSQSNMLIEIAGFGLFSIQVRPQFTVFKFDVNNFIYTQQNDSSSNKHIQQCTLLVNSYKKTSRIPNKKINSTKNKTKKSLTDSVKQTFRCSLCNAICVSMKVMVLHYKQRHAVMLSFYDLLSCKHCNLVFPDHQSLNEHVNSFHNGRLNTPCQCLSSIEVNYKCIECHSLHPCLVLLNKHLEEDHDLTVFPICKICKAPFFNLKGYLNHECIMDSLSEYTISDHARKYLHFHIRQSLHSTPCYICNKPVIGDIEKHCVEHAMANLDCYLCDKRFSNEYLHSCHLKEHHNSTDFHPVQRWLEKIKSGCEILVRILDNQKFKRVLPIEHCKRCDSSFLYLETLWIHNMMVHGTDFWSCYICGTFLKRCEVKPHAISHATDSFDCFICGHAVYMNANMIRKHLVNDHKLIIDKKVKQWINNIASGLEIANTILQTERSNTPDLFQCGRCYRIYRYKASAIIHARRAHQTSWEKIQIFFEQDQNQQSHCRSDTILMEKVEAVKRPLNKNIQQSSSVSKSLSSDKVHYYSLVSHTSENLPTTSEEISHSIMQSTTTKNDSICTTKNENPAQITDEKKSIQSKNDSLQTAKDRNPRQMTDVEKSIFNINDFMPTAKAVIIRQITDEKKSTYNMNDSVGIAKDVDSRQITDEKNKTDSIRTAKDVDFRQITDAKKSTHNENDSIHTVKDVNSRQITDEKKSTYNKNDSIRTVKDVDSRQITDEKNKNDSIHTAKDVNPRQITDEKNKNDSIHTAKDVDPRQITDEKKSTLNKNDCICTAKDVKISAHASCAVCIEKESTYSRTSVTSTHNDQNDDQDSKEQREIIYQHIQNLTLSDKSFTISKYYKCSICHAVFFTLHESNNHVITSHLLRYTLHDFTKHMDELVTCFDYLSQHFKEKLHSCKICKLTFIYPAECWTHIFTHFGYGNNKCIVCTERFGAVEELRFHLFASHQCFFCSLCYKLFHCYTDLHHHLQLHVFTALMPRNLRNGSHVIVSEANENWKEKQQVLFLVDKLKEPTFLKTSKIPEVFLSDKQKRFYCHLCEGIIAKGGELFYVIHMSLHKLPRKLMCLICEEEFAKEEQLTHHIVEHFEKYKFKFNKRSTTVKVLPRDICKICFLTFDTHDKQKIHSNHFNNTHQPTYLYFKAVIENALVRCFCSKEKRIFKHSFFSVSESGQFDQDLLLPRPPSVQFLTNGLTYGTIAALMKIKTYQEHPAILSKDSCLNENEDLQVCPYCHIKLNEKLSQHLVKHVRGRNNVIKCFFCGYFFKNNALCDHVLRRHRELIDYDIPMCPFCFVDQKHLTKLDHFKKHLEGDCSFLTLKCAYCPFTIYPYNLHSHDLHSHMKEMSSSAMLNRFQQSDIYYPELDNIKEGHFMESKQYSCIDKNSIQGVKNKEKDSSGSKPLLTETSMKSLKKSLENVTTVLSLTQDQAIISNQDVENSSTITSEDIGESITKVKTTISQLLALKTNKNSSQNRSALEKEDYEQFCKKIYISKKNNTNKQDDVSKKENTKQDDISKKDNTNEQGDKSKEDNTRQDDISKKDNTNKQGDKSKKDNTNKQGDKSKKDNTNKQGDKSKKDNTNKQGDKSKKDNTNKQGDKSKKDNTKQDDISKKENNKGDDISKKDATKQDDVSKKDDTKQDDISKNDINKQDDVLKKDDINKQDDVLKKNNINKQDDISKKENHKQDGDVSKKANTKQDDVSKKDINKQDDVSKKDIDKQDDVLKKYNTKQDDISKKDDTKQDIVSKKDDTKQDDISKKDINKQDDVSKKDINKQDEVSKKDINKQDDVLKKYNTKQDDISKKENNKGDDISKKDINKQDNVSKKDNINKQDDISKNDINKQDDVSKKDNIKQDDVSKKDDTKQDDVSKKDDTKQDDVSKKDINKQDDISKKYNTIKQDFSNYRDAVLRELTDLTPRKCITLPFFKPNHHKQDNVLKKDNINEQDDKSSPKKVDYSKKTKIDVTSKGKINVASIFKNPVNTHGHFNVISTSDETIHFEKKSTKSTVGAKRTIDRNSNDLIQLRKKLKSSTDKNEKEHTRNDDQNPVGANANLLGDPANKISLPDKKKRKKYFFSYQNKFAQGKYCDVCNSNVTEDMDKHLFSEHQELFTIECRYCNVIFPKKETCEKHITSAHLLLWNVEKNYCKICMKSFSSLNPLHWHLNVIHMRKNEESYCAICMTLFKDDLKFQQHQFKYHQHDCFKCLLCNEKFENFSASQQHIRKHKLKTIFFCAACQYYFDSNELLTLHIKKSCSSIHSLNDTNTRSKELTVQEHQLLIKRLYCCASCKLSFINLVSMKHHINTTHFFGAPLKRKLSRKHIPMLDIIFSLN